MNANEYLAALEKLARQFVFSRFLKSGDGADYFKMIYADHNEVVIPSEIDSSKLSFGNIENNFVFNYLDYLIWCDQLRSEQPDEVIKQFEFTFRSSVEHFYPQHPMDGHIYLPREYLDRFGNLCLVNITPEFSANASNEAFTAFSTRLNAFRTSFAPLDV